jgi:hypothetical protein
MKQTSSTPPVPVILLGNVFAQKFSDAVAGLIQSTPADLSLSGGKMNPLELFAKYSPIKAQTGGTALVIMNQLKTPLTGVNCLETNLGSALSCHPAIIWMGACKPDVIPGQQLYPIPSAHGKGDPASPDSWLSALGIYHFKTIVLATSGVAFSLKEDGSGPLLGVAFKEVLTAPFTHFAVSTDLSTFGKTTPEDNLDALANASTTPGSWWQEGNGTIQIKAGWASEPGSFATGMRILAVWVGPDDAQPFDPDDPGQFLDPLDPYGDGN